MTRLVSLYFCLSVHLVSLYVCLSLPVRLSFCTSCPPECLSLSTCTSVFQYVCLYVLSPCMSVFLYVFSPCMSVSLFVYVCLSVRLSLSTCMSVCLYVLSPCTLRLSLSSLLSRRVRRVLPKPSGRRAPVRGTGVLTGAQLALQVGLLLLTLLPKPHTALTKHPLPLHNPNKPRQPRQHGHSGRPAPPPRRHHRHLLTKMPVNLKNLEFDSRAVLSAPVTPSPLRKLTSQSWLKSP